MILKDCRELPNESNDGDSFHVRAAGKEYIFRLYFVDAPETDASFPERVKEQATYFGLTQPQTLQLGNFAKRFTKEKLTRPFTVRTCMQDALGRSAKERFYAFIETSEGDLAELLVANGMARVHGSVATPVGLNSPERERQKLERLEREAKLAKVGAWGARIGRMTARLAQQPSKTGADSFNAFFHPEKLTVPEEMTSTRGAPVATGSSPSPAASSLPNATPVAAASPTPVAAANDKLDPNTATAKDLMAVPGIGGVLASRIIAARPYKSADELRKVKGIGEKRLSQIRPFFQ